MFSKKKPIRERLEGYQPDKSKPNFKPPPSGGSAIYNCIENKARNKRKYYDALIANGFSHDDAILIVSRDTYGTRVG
jgi:hypothetical protein